MPLDLARYEALCRHQTGPIAQVYYEKDTILYALGLGLGQDPCDAGELRFVYEEGLCALPTMATVLCSATGWMHDPRYGIDAARIVHGEQHLLLHRPLAPSGKLSGQLRVAHVFDKGLDKGAVIWTERELVDAANGQAVCTLRSATVARGDGGFGGPAGQETRRPALPAREPDWVDALPTSPRAALLYRLNGDRNPLHASPVAARAAGFDRPILHGLCTYGMAAWSIVRRECDGDPARLRAIGARFSSPVFPGEALRVEAWREAEEIVFRVLVAERQAVVLAAGRAEVLR